MKLEIQSTMIPGTLMDKVKMGNVTGMEFLEKIFYITDGIMLSQIRALSGIDGSTLQNWTKRGWVSNAHNKRYDINQLSRILIINMMRESMQLERIAQLLTYVNGRAGDAPTTSYPSRSCTITSAASLMSLCATTRDTLNVRELVKKTLADYEERCAGARHRLEVACEIIVLAYFATLVRQKANSLFDSNLSPS